MWSDPFRTDYDLSNSTMIHPTYIRARLRLAWHHWTTRPSEDTLNRWVFEFPVTRGYTLPEGMPQLRSADKDSPPVPGTGRDAFVVAAAYDYLKRVMPADHMKWRQKNKASYRRQREDRCNE